MADIDIREILNAAIAGEAPMELEDDTTYSVVVPDGFQHIVAYIDQERHAAHPKRKRGTTILHTAQAFSAFVNHHKDVGSHIYASHDERTFWAVLNDASNDATAEFILTGSANGDGARWADHAAKLTLAYTPEWDHWASKTGSLMSQEEFAEHLEDGVSEIAVPNGASLMEIVTTFKAKVAVPEEFVLVLSPFEGSDQAEVKARLRYRINAGKLTIGYKLVRPEVVLKQAFIRTSIDIAEETAIEVWRGTPTTGVGR